MGAERHVMTRFSRTALLASLATTLLLPLGACATAQTSSDAATAEAPASREVEGYWHHDRLITSKGVELPIEGVFLMHDGEFLEQAVMGAPLDTPAGDGAEAMAHAGPYEVTDKGVKLTAEQTIAISASGPEPLSFRPNTYHDLTVENTGDNLTLTFGSGTVQTFTRIPSANIAITRFANGRLALTGNRWVMVAGDANAVVSGYGTFVRNGDKLSLTATRWAESTRQKANVQSDVQVEATLTDTALTLADGRSFAIRP